MTLIRASRRCIALATLPKASATAFEDFSKSFQLRLDYPVQTTGDFIDQNLNKGEPVPSILLDQLIQTIETKKQFIDISYHLWRFRHSPFSYKMRPWTNYFLITKGVNLGAYEALVELLLKSETYGCFPDSASLCYLLLNLVENGENQLAVEACVDLTIKDLCGSEALAKLCLNIILSNLEILESCEAKQIYAAIRIIGNILKNEKLQDLGASGIAKSISDEEVTKDDHFYIDPYVNYEELCSNPEIEYETFIEELQTAVDQSIFGALENELKDVLNESVETFKLWDAEATDLHRALENLVLDRKDWAERYKQLEKEFKAGVQYALSQTGLFNQRQAMEQRGSERMPKLYPPYMENEYFIVAVSDLELEQDIYEAKNPEEWNKIKTFFENRKEEKEQALKERRAPLRRSYKTNERWNGKMFSEFDKPNSTPRLPIE